MQFTLSGWELFKILSLILEIKVVVLTFPTVAADLMTSSSIFLQN
jgi:hypothetical protein